MSYWKFQFGTGSDTSEEDFAPYFSNKKKHVNLFKRSIEKIID